MRGIALLLVLLLSGCGKSFDKRYSDIETEVKKDANNIDQDLHEEERETDK
ncbi:hypothetical protein [Sphingorhabdus pulchriflava]|uniref:hypothetical protein n=1 Tax=Sphingorhabdus pulchriflava TaxID=2292257 RepID=UPI0015F198E4|nr:hypothetical protein [Sphingorhabdus pulchriflava]